MHVATDTPASANGDLAHRVQQLRLDTRIGAPTARGGGSWLPWVLCGMLALTWAGVGVRWYRAQPTDRDDGPAARPAAPSAGTSVPAAAAGELIVQLKGNVIPSLQIAVSPVDVAGEVTDVRFKEGDRVKKGDVLAVIRDTRYRNELNTARATYEATVQRYRDNLPEAVRTEEMAEMKAQIDEAEATRLQAAQEFERTRSQRAAGAVAAQDVEKAEANLKTAEARIARLRKSDELLRAGSRKEKVLAAKADVDAARARLDEAERMVKNCEVRSPIGGTVLTKKADIGSLVSPMSFNVAASLCEVADLSRVEVEVDVPERQITRVKPGQNCRIMADADPDRVYRGYVDRVMPIADDSKNVVKIRVRVVLPKTEEAGAFLKPKMGATVLGYNTPFVKGPDDQE